MGCTIYTNTIVCNHTAGTYRLPLADGTRVYLDWHNNPLICDVLEWFQKRGNKA